MASFMGLFFLERVHCRRRWWTSLQTDSPRRGPSADTPAWRSACRSARSKVASASRCPCLGQCSDRDQLEAQPRCQAGREAGSLRPVAGVWSYPGLPQAVEQRPIRDVIEDHLHGQQVLFRRTGFDQMVLQHAQRLLDLSGEGRGDVGGICDRPDETRMASRPASSGGAGRPALGESHQLMSSHQGAHPPLFAHTPPMSNAALRPCRALSIDGRLSRCAQ